MVSQTTIDIGEDGSIRIKDSLVQMIESLSSGRYKIIIAPRNEYCSVPQRQLMWMWFTFLEEQTGTTRTEWHDYFVKKFVGEEFTSTKNFTRRQLTTFMNHVQAEVETEWGYTLPLPSDLGTDEYDLFIREYLGK